MHCTAFVFNNLARQFVIMHITFRKFLITILFFFLVPGQSAADEKNIQLVFYASNSEIHTKDKTGGLPALATLLKTQRSAKNKVLFLHGGGAIAPSTLSSFDRGAHMIDLLNQLEPSVFSVAKSELAYKEDELSLRSLEASFPFISSNLYDPLTSSAPEGIEPYLIINTDGITIGIFSIMDPEVAHEYLPGRTSVVDVQKTIAFTPDLLRSKGADIVILMTEYAIPEIEEYLGNGIIDIVLMAEDKSRDRSEKKGIYLEHGRDDSAFIINLTIEQTHDAFSWQHTQQLVTLDTLRPDPNLKTSVENYLSKLTKLLGVVIGTTTTQLDTREHNVRTSENAFANLVADSIRFDVNADIALINGGGIRGDRIYPAGMQLTRGDIHREIPFRNHVVVISTTGEQILDGLENGFSRLKDVKGRFPHVSGMQVTYDPSAPVGDRVRKVMIGDAPLDKGKSYSLATVNFLANGGDGYTAFRSCPHLQVPNSNRLLWEYVRDYIVKKERISPAIEGRLKTVSR